MYCRKKFLFKSKLDRKNILLILMTLYFSSPLLACSSPEDDDPRLRGVYESSEFFFEIKDCKERISNLESLLDNDQVIFNSKNGFITFYNICFQISGAYADMKDDKGAYQTLNRILDHQMCDAKTLGAIDNTASTRLPILIQLNIKYSDVGHCFKALSLFSELTNRDLVESYRLMSEENRGLLFDKPRMKKKLLDMALEAVNRNMFSSMSSDDHYLYYRCLLGQPRQDLDIFKDKSIYEHAKSSLGSEKITPKNTITLFDYLSKTSFQLGYYEECIGFYKKLSSHKGGLNPDDEIEFAQSYYQIGIKEEAIKILLELFNNEITIALPSLDLCLMLFDCFPDTDEKYVQSSIIRITRKVLPPEETNKKDNPKKKTKGNSYSQTRSRVIQEFIKDRLQKGSDEFQKINSIKLDTIARFYTAENGFEKTDELAEMASLQEKSSQVFDALKSLSLSSLSEAKKARELSDFLKESASKLLSFNASVQEIIRNSMREKSLKVSTTPALIYDVSDTPSPSLKSQVMFEHSQKVAKVKTRGTPDDRDLQGDLRTSETSKEPEIQENSIGNFVGIAEKIFYEDDGNIRNFPNELISIARDKLHLLSKCQSINELQTSLPPGADLKKISGNPTTWQFRINDTYRVRFTLGDHKFLNVNVGDFH